MYDAEGKTVTKPSEIYKIVNTHFQNHFNDPNLQSVTAFTGDARKLEEPITTAEVRNAVNTMTNNRAPGYDNINVELTMYAHNKLPIPKELIYADAADFLTKTLMEENTSTIMLQPS